MRKNRRLDGGEIMKNRDKNDTVDTKKEDISYSKVSGVQKFGEDVNLDEVNEELLNEVTPEKEKK